MRLKENLKFLRRLRLTQKHKCGKKLKNAPKQWHEKFDSVMIKDGFTTINATSLFTLKQLKMHISLFISIWMTY